MGGDGKELEGGRDELGTAGGRSGDKKAGEKCLGVLSC